MARQIATNTTVNRAELEEFVRPRHNGILMTTRVDGSPQMSPVTMASVCILSDEFGGAWVQVNGTAEVIDLPDSVEPLVEYFRCIAGEHPDWDEYREAMRAQGKSLIRITIESWGPIATGGFPARLAES
jgi:hypothetical protein